MKKRSASAAFLSLLLAAAMLVSCAKDVPDGKNTGTTPDTSLLAGEDKTDDIRPGSGPGSGNGTDITIDLSSNMFSFTRSGAVQPKRDNTVLIYLVGSNLETNTQAASADLMEIFGSGADPEKTNVVVCTGGARGWWTQIPSDRSSILRLIKGGNMQFEAESSSPVNMGDAQTIVDFLNFGVATYPADHYSLIFWDHGLGPVQGFCYDEIFDDVVELPELKAALEASVFGSGAHLDWVGFDACLMADAQLAKLLSPYADYMVASQEIESAYGWNYDFLSKLNETSDPEVITRQVIESYETFFEENRTSYFNPDVTLSVMDLKKIDILGKALDDLFAVMLDELEDDGYYALAASREKMKSFGVAASGGNDNAMDLVDIGDLAACSMEAHRKEATALLAAMDDFVVAQVSNVPDSSGLSLYYPYYNELLYLYFGLSPFEDFVLSENCMAYMERFAKIKTSGDEPQQKPEDWDLIFASFDTGKSDETGLSLKLTAEQMQHTTGVTYTIFCKIDDEELYWPMTMFLDAEPAGDGEIFLPLEELYFYAAHTDRGESLPWPVMEVESRANRRTLTTLTATLDNTMVYYPWGDHDQFSVNFLERKETGDTLIQSVERTDESEQIGAFSAVAGKGTVDVGDWDYISYARIYVVPTEDEEGNLLPFNEWERPGYMNYQSLQLDSTFRFERVPLSDMPHEKYCQMFVFDEGGAVHVSDLLKIYDPDEPVEEIVKQGTNTLYFRCYSDHAVLTLFEGEGGEVKIPETVKGVPVTAIDSRAFSTSDITSVDIPDTVTELGYKSFYLCEELQSVRLPEGLTKIPEECFSWCTSLDDITLPDSLVTLDVFSFAHTPLTKIRIPASVTDIRAGAFAECDLLTDIELESEDTYHMKDGVLYSADEKTLICFLEEERESFMVPDGVTRIEDYAFAGNYTLTSVTWPKTLEEIGDFAFYAADKLTDAFDFPDSLRRIGAGAFYGLFLLDDQIIEEVHIGAGIRSIGISAFDHRYIRRITVDEDNEVYASANDALTNKNKDYLIMVPAGIDGRYEVADTIAVIHEDAFSTGSGITELVIPDSVIAMDCITLPGDVISIGSGLMDWYAVSRIVRVEEMTISEDNPYFLYEDGVIYDKDRTLIYNILMNKDGSSFTIPDTVTEIADYGLHASLSAINIPESLVSGLLVTGYDYYGSQLNGEDLERISVHQNNPVYTTVDGMLYTADKTILITIPQASAGNRIDIPKGTEIIASGALGLINDSLEVHIPDGVTFVGNMCGAISVPLRLEGEMRVDFYFPESVTSIASALLRYLSDDAKEVLTIHAPAGSFADMHFREKGLEVVNDI